ncbi:MAG: glycosyltransferase family 1 protein [Chloroflexi bacterium]|nr:glycosyltransferase family 1 protein [Chloroflexota bacterium]
MKISILTYGSRGDVQPFLALAIGLQKRGHEVTLAAPHRFANFVAQYNIPFAPLAGDPEEISKAFNDAGHNAVKMIRAIGDYVNSIALDVTRGAFAACEDADLIVHSFLFTTGAHSLARARGIPDVSIQTFPIFAPTREYPPVALSSLPRGALSYFGHWLDTQVFWYGGNSGYNQKRKQHPDVFSFDLFWPFDEKPPRRATPLLFAVSPTALPPAREWAGRVDVTGYFFLDAPDTFTPSAELTSFLEAGPPPICVTFGSMIHRDADRIAEIMLESIHQAGQRAIILTGWDGWGGRVSSGDFLFLESAPHDWLLPRCKAIIHHGGAGTTAAGLRAGIPNIVIPFGGDQLFWGERVRAIGAGPRPVRVRALTAPRLTSALAAIEDAALCARVRLVGQKVRREDGVGSAIRVVESRLVG